MEAIFPKFLLFSAPLSIPSSSATENLVNAGLINSQSITGLSTQQAKRINRSPFKGKATTSRETANLQRANNIIVRILWAHNKQVTLEPSLNEIFSLTERLAKKFATFKRPWRKMARRPGCAGRLMTDTNHRTHLFSTAKKKKTNIWDYYTPAGGILKISPFFPLHPTLHFPAGSYGLHLSAAFPVRLAFPRRSCPPLQRLVILSH